MRGSRIIPNSSPLALQSEAGALPAPTGATTDGDLSTLQASDGYLPESALLSIDTDPAAATVTIPGPVTIRAKRGGRWRHAGTLNGGDGITVSEHNGFEDRVYLGAGWTNLVVVAGGALVGGTVTVSLTEEAKI